MEPTEDKHWDSLEFDDLIDRASATDDNAEHIQLLKQAYLLAKREAPWAKTAGTAGLKVKMDSHKSGRVFLSQIDLEGLRRFLEENGLLDDEDSSE